GGVAAGQLAVRLFEPAGDTGSSEDFEAAVKRAQNELEELMARQGELAAGIVEFQLALLDDEDFLEPVRKRIKAGVPWRDAWNEMVDGEISEYKAGGDDFLAARADDLDDLKRRVAGGGAIVNDLHDGDILVTSCLSPTQFLQLDTGHLAGIALSGGHPAGHVAILARDKGVNMITGLKADLSGLEDKSAAIIDAGAGTLSIRPGKKALAAAAQQMELQKSIREAAARLVHKPARMSNGEAVKVMLNVGAPGSLEALSPDMCDGIGLTRTEFLFAGQGLPGEDRQFDAYRQIVEWAAGRPVTIRLLDAGGDKPVAGITPDNESNPFLGVRGVRLLLDRPDVLACQLRAILRAACLGPVKIMVPMVAVPQEMTDMHKHLAAAQNELAERGTPCGDVELGMMVEVPSAALMAEHFDTGFYSIGSNDLIQYTLAAARDNPAVAHLGNGRNEAVLELIRRTVEAGRKTGRQVSLCGAMASDPAMVPVLLDKGLRILSVSPSMAGQVKLAVSQA
ncbi:MAG TPA: phosphoenolpyruvate--protein phosphotransferase, partial [Rhizobiales bacterium]|nr:phosphoenolpyruvate--protein phosphotransferase [Hyphomicrobiales bacterium]